MHSIVTTFREAVIKVEVANFGAAIDTLIDQDELSQVLHMPEEVNAQGLGSQNLMQNIDQYLIICSNK